MNKRLSKTLIGATLSLTMMMAAGTMVLGSNPAHAAAPTAASGIISSGENFMGTPYLWGAAAGRTDRFDCSSFTQHVFAMNGIHIPRSSKQQSQAGTYVPRDQLRPGDLVFFYSPIHHVAIYIGNGKILHTYGSPGVTISNLNSGWWNSHYTTARRVLPSSAQGTVPVAPAPTVQPNAHPVAQAARVRHPASFLHPQVSAMASHTRHFTFREDEDDHHQES